MINTLLRWLEGDFISFMTTLNLQIPGALKKGVVFTTSTACRLKRRERSKFGSRHEEKMAVSILVKWTKVWRLE